ncbi:hypothetical protein CY34DRAFT_48425, partial [Suillus luteus UH-Slu-Lm8-n1]
MTYAADIWCAGLVSKGRGRKGGGRGARGFSSQMARVQRMATLLITGGLRSSATDLLDSHANVLPVHQTIRKICFRATLRLVMLPHTHPITNGLNTAYRFCAKRNFQGRKRHASPLHKLLNEFQVNPQQIEKISPIRHYPKWSPDTLISIAAKEKDAIKEEEQADERWQVYSD